MLEDKQFFYETHLHTSQASACATSTGREMAIGHKNAGYSGIIVTDHFVYGNTAIDRSLPWQDWVYAFCAGYRDAKAAGDEIGLDVYFGWESGYNGAEFLIYGLDEQWLMNHPQIKDATIEEQYKLVHESGGVVFHAHPYRERFYIPQVRLFPEYVDGVEVFNASNEWVDGKDLFNERALCYAEQYDFPQISGSDIHCDVPIMSGVTFERKPNDIFDFINMVMNRECSLIKNSRYCE